ncbi:MAG TPA: PEP-CTERM sorting domain-containing protein [Tepidisphaeraceae bacterium]|nr:PEP-CTERM sorting domain-containing protein [Tepidisphaeraceae bacterium]
MHTQRMFSLVGAGLIVGAVATEASAVVTNPFTETFATSDSNWKNSAMTAPTYDAAGQFISVSATVTGAQQGLFRAQDAFSSSNNNFVGNWLSAGISEIRFSIRHDAPTALQFAMRVAVPANSPAISAISNPVEPGAWRDVVLPLTPGTVSQEGGSFNGVMSDAAKLLLFMPSGNASTTGPVTFQLDNVSITPEPGTLGLLGLTALGCLARRRARRA